VDRRIGFLAVDHQFIISKQEGLQAGSIGDKLFLYENSREAAEVFAVFGGLAAICFGLYAVAGSLFAVTGGLFLILDCLLAVTGSLLAIDLSLGTVAVGLGPVTVRLLTIEFALGTVTFALRLVGLDLFQDAANHGVIFCAIGGIDLLVVDAQARHNAPHAGDRIDMPLPMGVQDLLTTAVEDMVVGIAGPLVIRLGLRTGKGEQDGRPGEDRIELTIHGICLPGILRDRKKVTGILDLIYLWSPMTAHDRIAAYVRKFVPLSEEEAMDFTAPFKEVKIKKRQFIVQPGFVAKHRWWVIKGAVPAFETFFRILAERSTASMQRRIIMSLTHTAEERYHYFLEKYPLMAERLPQYVIASFLGMTTKFLSKIRNEKVKRKK